MIMDSLRRSGLHRAVIFVHGGKVALEERRAQSDELIPAMTADKLFLFSSTGTALHFLRTARICRARTGIDRASESRWCIRPRSSWHQMSRQAYPRSLTRLVTRLRKVSGRRGPKVCVPLMAGARAQLSESCSIQRKRSGLGDIPQSRSRLATAIHAIWVRRVSIRLLRTAIFRRQRYGSGSQHFTAPVRMPRKGCVGSQEGSSTIGDTAAARRDSAAR